MYTVGLTGCMGSGKTTVAELFAQQGVAVVDTDRIARELTQQNGAAISPLRSLFGKAAFLEDGSLNRSYMRSLIFSDPFAKKNLEAVLHPLILQKSQYLIAHLKSDMPYCLLVVPLLCEHYGDYRSLVHQVLVVDCEERLQIKRIKKRNGYCSAMIQAMLFSQFSRQKKKLYADDIIFNNDDLLFLRQAVKKKHLFYQRYFSKLPTIS